MASLHLTTILVLLYILLIIAATYTIPLLHTYSKFTDFTFFITKQSGLKTKLEQFRLKLPWIERLDFTSEPAPIAPELNAEVSN